MNNGLTAVDYDALAPVRDYVQDVSKLVGKFQQAFLPAALDETNKGLFVYDDGIVSQEIIINTRALQLRLDLIAGFLVLDKDKWSLPNHSPQRLFQEVLAWDARNNSKVEIAKPDFVTAKSLYDVTQASLIITLLKFSYNQLNILRSLLPSGSLSPIFLYPHHFDLSMNWLSGETRHTVGFSFGDENISEPYFYVTEYPESATSKGINLLKPAYWQQTGFSGAVMKYSDLVTAPNPQESIMLLFKTVLAI